jgi:hypothetical protein
VKAIKPKMFVSFERIRTRRRGNRRTPVCEVSMQGFKTL